MRILSASRVIICVIIIIGLCFPVWATANQGGTRHHDSVTTFLVGIEKKTLTFMMEGSDSSLVVELPENAKIESATVDIEGRIVRLGNKDKVNFTDTTNNTAWEDTTNQEFPLTSAPTKFMASKFGYSDYKEVEALDGKNKSTMGGASSAGYPVQLYEFNLSSYAPIIFDVFWAGNYMSWNFGCSDGMNVSIWNATSKTWEIIGGYFATQGVNPSGNVFFGKSYKNLLDYINPTSKLLYLGVLGPQGIGFSYCEIFTDYIGINISQDTTPSYPKNPYLDIGKDEDNEWAIAGDFSTKATFSGTKFVNELQEHVNTGTPEDGKIQIPFVFGSAKRGRLHISNLTIMFATNKAPTNPMEIYSISFKEDFGWYETIVNLTSYFQDLDDTLSNLTFQLNGNTPDIWGVITPGYMLNFTSSADCFGVAEFNVSCRDKGYDGITNDDDSIVYSNNFTVTVLPSDDSPVIYSIDDESVIDNEFSLVGYEDEYLNFTVIAGDIDGDEIFYSINITDEALVLDGNNISFLPTQEYVGFFNFTIKATESNLSELYDFVNISIVVKNTNDGPTLEELADSITVDEDVWLNFTLKASDIDLAYDKDEKLTFKTNFSDAEIASERWKLDEDTGQFSFLPDNSLVGRYLINFTVEDNYEEMDWCDTIVEVKNVNDPPIAKPISVFIVDADNTTPELENLTIGFSTESAGDPDIIHGDVLTYSWDFDKSDGILIDAFGQNVEWSYPTQGNYTVTLTVSDSGTPKLTNSTSVIVHVLAVKEQPTEEPEEEDNTTVVDTSDKDKEGTTSGSWIPIGLIILVIVIICIVMLFIWKKRQKTLEEEYDESKEEAGPLEQPPMMMTPTQFPPTMVQGMGPYGMQPAFYYPPPPVPAMGMTMPPPAQQVQIEPTEQQYLPPGQTTDTDSMKGSEGDEDNSSE